jgi:hypothetical protein
VVEEVEEYSMIKSIVKSSYELDSPSLLVNYLNYLRKKVFTSSFLYKVCTLHLKNSSPYLNEELMKIFENIPVAGVGTISGKLKGKGDFFSDVVLKDHSFKLSGVKFLLADYYLVSLQYGSEIDFIAQVKKGFYNECQKYTPVSTVNTKENELCITYRFPLYKEYVEELYASFEGSLATDIKIVDDLIATL